MLAPQEAGRPWPRRIPDPVDPVAYVVPADWKAAASMVGYTTPEMEKWNAISFAAERQIPVYDYDQVAEFMEDLAANERQKASWRPLREKDRKKFETCKLDGGIGYPLYDASKRRCDPYDQIVPISILRRIKLMQGGFGDYGFFISDCGRDTEPKFVLGTSTSTIAPMIVFGTWDKPEFGTPDQKEPVLPSLALAGGLDI